MCRIRQAEWEEQWPSFQKTLSNSTGTTSTLENRSRNVLSGWNLCVRLFCLSAFLFASLFYSLILYLSSHVCASVLYFSLFLVPFLFYLSYFRLEGTGLDGDECVWVCVWLRHAALLGGHRVPNCCLNLNRTSHSMPIVFSLFLSLHSSTALSHTHKHTLSQTHQLTGANWPVGPADRRCVR